MTPRIPRLLDHQLRERTRLQPVRLSLNLQLTPLSTAEMVLSNDDADVSLRDYVELYDENGSAGIFRVAEIDCQPGLTRTLRLEHGLSSLADVIIHAYSFTGSIPDCLTGLLDRQHDVRWVLGDCETPDDLSVSFACSCEDGLSALLRLINLLPSGYALFFDQTSLPWKLHLRALSDQDACEGRLSRNLTGVQISQDGTALCTRIYPFGAGQGTERVTLYPLTGSYYLQSDAADTWGVISRTFTAPSIYDAVTLQNVAQRYLALHGVPTVSIIARAVDLSAITGEAADAFRLGRMCRLALNGMVLHERVIGLEKPDVIGAPGETIVTLCTRIRDASDEIAALLRDATADKLLGGRVVEIKKENYGDASTLAPAVHYFNIENWTSLLDVRVTLNPDTGVTVKQVRVDGADVPAEVWRSGSFSAMAYLTRNELGLPAVARHHVSIYPSNGTTGELCGIGSTVTLTVIQSV